MYNRILSMGLCMIALTALVFVVYQVAAEPNAQGGVTTGESSSLAEPRAKIATDSHSNADFDGDGMVGFSDFLAFAGQFGAQRGEGRYQAKYVGLTPGSFVSTVF